MHWKAEYKYFPPQAYMMDFNTKDNWPQCRSQTESKLNSRTGITGISIGIKILKIRETSGRYWFSLPKVGFMHFCYHPANELFNLSLSLETILTKAKVNEVQENYRLLKTDKQRIKAVEQIFTLHN